MSDLKFIEDKVVSTAFSIADEKGITDFSIYRFLEYDEYKLPNLIYSNMFVQVNHVDGLYIISYLEPIDSHKTVSMYCIVKNDDLVDCSDMIKKAIKKYKHKNSDKYVHIYRCIDSEWTTINSIKIKKHKPMITDMYNECVNMFKIIESYKGIARFNSNMLLAGPPGVGKSKFVLDIAVYLKYRIVYMDIKSNTFKSSRHEEEAIFLFEEIDKLLDPNGEFISNEVDQSNLLSFLDGIIRHESTIVIMTCNDLDKVKKNKVLTRSGRVNNIYKFSTINIQQCSHLLNIYYKDIDPIKVEQFYEQLPNKEYITAAILSAFIQRNILKSIAFDDIRIEEINDLIDSKKDNYYMYS